MANGIEVRHARGCRQRHGGRCNCDKAYRASAWSVRDDNRVEDKGESGQEFRRHVETRIAPLLREGQEALGLREE
jgi:hypothetical protein